MKKKILSILLATALVASLAGCGDDANTGGGGSNSGGGSSNSGGSENNGGGDTTTDVTVDTISMWVDGTLTANQENGRDELVAQWEAAVGVNLVVNQIDHNSYKETVQRLLATGDKPDVMLMSAEMFKSYASMTLENGEPYLWDMTDAYNNAEFQARLINPEVNERLKVNGRMYGFTPVYGNGCVTHVKKSWLDAVGMSVDDIKTFDDYYEMLVRFTTMDPDGNGKNDTYGTAAHLILLDETPYINYLPEFWQDAYPAITQDANGVWIDGFDTDATKAALLRLQKAYQEGVINPMSTTMSTKEVREGFWSADQAASCGAYAYWAGTWTRTTVDNIHKNLGEDEEIVLLPVIEEVKAAGGLIDREAPVWVILNDGDNSNTREQQIFDLFIETMLDGDTVQTLWAYGAEGVHWSTAADVVTLIDADGNVIKEIPHEEGEFHFLAGLVDSSKLWGGKNLFDPTFMIAPLTNGYGSSDPVIAAANEFFIANQRVAPSTPSSEAYSLNYPSIREIQEEVVEAVVVNNEDVDTWMQYYRDMTGPLVQEVLDSLNVE